MARLFGFSIHDSKAEAFMQPFFAPTMGIAERSFQEACRNPETPMAKYPADFSLWVVGEFDEATGTLSPGERGPYVLMQGVQVPPLNSKPEIVR